MVLGTVTGFGVTLNGFEEQLIICSRDSCISVNEQMEMLGKSYFNTYADLLDIVQPYSHFSHSSVTIDSSSFLIQSISYFPSNISDIDFDNLIWKLSPSGEVIDSIYIQKLGTDELHYGNFLRKDEERICGASVMRNYDTEVFLPAADSLFFFAINENLDSLWSSSYGDEDFYYDLLGIEVQNHCLIAYGKEIPIDGQDWDLNGNFFILKYSWEDLELTIEEQVGFRQEFTLYPNPAHNKISINMNEIQGNIKSIKVYDVLGKEIYSKNLIGENDQRIEININSWVDGLYVVKVSTKDRSFSSRFVKE